MGAEIGDVVRQKAGRDVDLPEDDGRRWLRFPCPFCGKPRAAISYEIGLFICHHADCGMKLWRELPGANYHAIARFRLQIEQAARNIESSWRKRFSKHDVIQQARLFVIEYDDAGLIDDWEADLDGDQNQVDRYMLRELNCDLGNWARKVVRRKRRENQNYGDMMEEIDEIVHRPLSRVDRAREERPSGPRRMVWQRAESVEDIAMWVSWPTLGMYLRQDMSESEIASRLSVSVSTVKRMLAREMRDAAKTYREVSLENFSNFLTLFALSGGRLTYEDSGLR